MNSLAVRPARLDDLDQIVALRVALLREYREHPLYTELRDDVQDRARELYFSQLAAPDETIFLAERAGRIVGLLRCVDTPGSPLLMPERYCYVSSVYVVPAERRRGVLRALLAAAERWCEQRGLAEMRLHNAASARAAAAVWSAFGFEVVEEVRRRVLPTQRPASPTPRTHAGAR
jgi:ribosomal protein S18 acetylase RimI-like enzyme